AADADKKDTGACPQHLPLRHEGNTILSGLLYHRLRKNQITIMYHFAVNGRFKFVVFVCCTLLKPHVNRAIINCISYMQITVIFLT
ncbi:MAG: hypothetical protein PHX81_07530, partial [Eubacteriales bacterium]|nr:hypothetical protein [Eubacteriales bacterium]MDD4140059.1 hypothetical protein [Eubacteriales bacterium]